SKLKLRSRASGRANLLCRQRKDVLRLRCALPRKPPPIRVGARLEWTSCGHWVLFSLRTENEASSLACGRLQDGPFQRRNEIMISRRALLKSGAGAVATTLAAPAIAQAPKKISFLTWNIIDQEPMIRGWITRFVKDRPGVEVEWLDKKGPEIPVFYQTQLVAGTPPDVINTQGALGLEDAAQGALVDLTPRLKAEISVSSRFNADYLSNWAYEGNNYMLPFYITKTLLFYNKPMFQTAGLSGPPRSFDAIIDAAQRMTSGEASGFLTLNFDWLSWPLCAMNGVDLLSKDLTHPTFNTPTAIEVTDRLAKATEAGAINKIPWTGRWVEPNGAFAAGNVGMLHAHSPAYFFFKGQGKWV